jgi:ABC-2 type transport system permease protein
MEWTMRRHALLICHFLIQALKTRMAYRWDFFVDCVSSLAADATGLITVTVILANTHALGEWSRWEVAFIYGVAMLSQALFGFIGRFWGFANRYIIEGEFDRVLMRPVNPLVQIMMENVQFEEFPSVLLGALVVYASSVKLGLAWGVADVLLLALFVVSGAMVLFGIFLAVISTGFWFEDRVGLVPPVFNLMAFGKYPITIFHPVVRFTLSFLIPFGFMAFYPATHFLSGSGTTAEFAVFCYLTPAIALLVFSIGYVVWRMGMRSYRSTGS